MLTRIRNLIRSSQKTVEETCVGAIPPNFQWITVEKMAYDTHQWIKEIPSDFDVVIGIPRSGLIPAAIIAGELGKPLTTPDLFLERKYWMSSAIPAMAARFFYNRVLLVDESGDSFHQFTPIYERLYKADPSISFIRAVQYVNKSAIREGKVDLWYKAFSRTSTPRFDINLAHNDDGRTAYDLDGVLCEDITLDHMKNYDHFIETARPYRIPVYPIKCIITGRNEKYRDATVKWLRKYHVLYRSLHMLPDGEDMIDFKCRILKMEKPSRFIESNNIIARECYDRTGIRCVALDTGIIYGGRR